MNFFHKKSIKNRCFTARKTQNTSNLVRLKFQLKIIHGIQE